MNVEDDEIHMLDYGTASLCSVTCKRCGITREMRVKGRRWVKIWRRPDGTEKQSMRAPPCKT